MTLTKRFTDWDKMNVLLEVCDVCILLQCTEVTVRKYLEKGYIKGNKIAGKWLVDRDSLREFFTKGVA